MVLQTCTYTQMYIELVVCNILMMHLVSALLACMESKAKQMMQRTVITGR